MLKQQLRPLQTQCRLRRQHSGIPVPGNQVILFIPSAKKKEWDQCKKIQLPIREPKGSNVRYSALNDSMISEARQCWYLICWYWRRHSFLNSSKILDTLPWYPCPGHDCLLQLRSFLTCAVDQANCFLTASLWIRKLILVVSGLLCFPSKCTVS